MDTLYKLIRPILFSLRPEDAHNITLSLLKYGRYPDKRTEHHSILYNEVFGRHFNNPIGLAAGFDKNASAIKNLYKIGFGFIEVGTVTPKPQPGNPKPRLFRLTEDHGIINRLGFNNCGAEKFRQNISKFRREHNNILGINIGKNKDAEDAIGDYLGNYKNLSSLADYLVINISSPNTPGLRELQNTENLEKLLGSITDYRNDKNDKTPILLKVAPDLSDNELNNIADISIHYGIDGIIATNTTITRPTNLKSANKNEIGGLSGGPLRELSNKVIESIYRHTKGSIPIIGVGGVSSGQDAYQKIRLGASLVQIYSALIFEGPDVLTVILKDLKYLLEKDGFQRLKEAVGVDVAI